MRLEAWGRPILRDASLRDAPQDEGGAGLPVAGAGAVMSLIRNVKGVLALNDNKPIANPASWMFG